MVYTNDDKFKCARRELEMRQRVYPGMIERGKLDSVKAGREIGVMQAIMDDYAALVFEESKQEEMFDEPTNTKALAARLRYADDPLAEIERERKAAPASPSFKAFHELNSYDRGPCRYCGEEEYKHCGDGRCYPYLANPLVGSSQVWATYEPIGRVEDKP